MKLLISLFTLFVLSFSPVPEKNLDMHSEDLVEQELVFDGYEGGYYFFSDATYQALVLEADEEHTPYELINGNLEGKSFKIAYKVVDPSPDSSTEGIIKEVKLLD